MSQKTDTIVSFLLDNTGSMDSVKPQTIEGFNSYVAGLAESDEPIRFTFVKFNSSRIDKVCVGLSIKEAPKLTPQNYQPMHGTPLVDAAMKTIRATEAYVTEHYKAGTPPKVLVTIQTDGEENASTEFRFTDLAALIKEKEAAGWSFTFLGAGLDAFKISERMGISHMNTMSYSTDAASTQAMFAASASNDVNAIRTGNMSARGYSSAQRVAAGDNFHGQHKPRRQGPIVGGGSAAPVVQTRPAPPKAGGAAAEPAKPMVDDLVF